MTLEVLAVIGCDLEFIVRPKFFIVVIEGFVSAETTEVSCRYLKDEEWCDSLQRRIGVERRAKQSNVVRQCIIAAFAFFRENFDDLR